MSGSSLLWRVASCLSAGALGVGTAVAVTFDPDQDRPAKPTHIDDIIVVDALGFSCIEEASIDVAFHLSGKGLRLPRTCLPEPCNAALSKPGLSGLIGRPPTQGEWDDYYARYADTCRKEVTAFNDAGDAGSGTDTDTPVAGDISDGPITADDFWEPLLPSYGPDAPILSQLSPRPPARTGLTGGTTSPLISGGTGGTGGATGSVGGGEDTSLVALTGGTSGDLMDQFASQSASDTSRVIPNPLPPSLLLLGGAVVVTAGLRRKLRR